MTQTTAINQIDKPQQIKVLMELWDGFSGRWTPENVAAAVYADVMDEFVIDPEVLAEFTEQITTGERCSVCGDHASISRRCESCVFDEDGQDHGMVNS